MSSLAEGVPLVAWRTVIDGIEAQARERADWPAHTFLINGEELGEVLTYAELARRARRIAAELQRKCQPGDRVLMLYPSGPAYVTAFLGCLYAGVIAVPAYPPDPQRLGRSVPRIEAMAADAAASAVLATASLCRFAEEIFQVAPDLKKVPWIASDAVAEGLEAAWTPPAIAPDDVAFIQYTSGSTSAPKGVLVTHQNIISSYLHIATSCQMRPRDVLVTWLPLFHDLGLIHSTMSPLLAGAHCVVMEPIAFLQRPIRWIQALSRFRGTHSGAPNFAFGLVCRRVTSAEIAGLDLSSCRQIVNAAEPVRIAVVEEFERLLAPLGLAPGTVGTAYGLAEGTAPVTIAPAGTPRLAEDFDPDALAQRKVTCTRDVARPHRMVSVGVAYPGSQLRIVDPDSCEPCPPNVVGEIWFSGPVVARGYWNKPAVSAETFNGRVAGTGDGPYLRTGDLGFVHSGELFIAGRLKDTIILNGRNHYPQDIELTVERVHPALRPGCSAAFAVDVDGREEVVIVQEFERRYRPDRRLSPGAPQSHPDRRATADRRGPAPEVEAFSAPVGSPSLESAPPPVDFEPIIEAIRTAVYAEHSIALYAIVLVRPGTIPKTSSGKTQRRASRQAYQSQKLETVHVWTREDRRALDRRSGGGDSALPTRERRPSEAPRSVASRATASGVAGQLPGVLYRSPAQPALWFWNASVTADGIEAIGGWRSNTTVVTASIGTLLEPVARALAAARSSTRLTLRDVVEYRPLGVLDGEPRRTVHIALLDAAGDDASWQAFTWVGEQQDALLLASGRLVRKAEGAGAAPLAPPLVDLTAPSIAHPAAGDPGAKEPPAIRSWHALEVAWGPPGDAQVTLQWTDRAGGGADREASAISAIDAALQAMSATPALPAATDGFGPYSIERVGHLSLHSTPDAQVRVRVRVQPAASSTQPGRLVGEAAVIDSNGIAAEASGIVVRRLEPPGRSPLGTSPRLVERLRDRLGTSDQAAVAEQEIATALSAWLARTLKLPSRPRSDASLVSLGMSSLVAFQLTEWIQAELSLQVSVAQVAIDTTVASLARMFVQQLRVARAVSAVNETTSGTTADGTSLEVFKP